MTTNFNEAKLTKSDLRISVYAFLYIRQCMEL